MIDPDNCSRWKHKWRGFGRDEIASEWARVEEWDKKENVSESGGQKRCCNHRNDECEAHSLRKWREYQTKEPRNVGLPDLSIVLRTDGTTVQLFGESNVAANGPMGATRWEEGQGKDWMYSEDAAYLVEEKKPTL